MQKRELERLKVLVAEHATSPHIDKSLYEFRSAELENGVPSMSCYTIRRLVEFAVDNFDYGYRIDTKKYNIIINSGVVKILMEDKLESISSLRKAHIILKNYIAIGKTRVRMGDLMVVISRWWLHLPRKLTKWKNEGNRWYTYSVEDMLTHIEQRIEDEREIYDQLVALEIRVKEAATHAKLRREVKDAVKQGREAIVKRKEERRRIREKYGPKRPGTS